MLNYPDIQTVKTVSLIAWANYGDVIVTVGNNSDPTLNTKCATFQGMNVS